jgi:DNA-binding response OmpR family regulator
MRVLLIEDDSAVARFAGRALHEDGAEVHLAATAADGARLAAAGAYDAIVVDLGLPDCNGMSVVEAVRRDGRTTPILVFTGLDDDEQVVRALDAGADDYLVKPVATDVLRARVRAAIRRGAYPPAKLLRHGSLELDRLARRALADGTDLRLTPKEFTLLETLMLDPGTVVSRAELLRGVWGMDFDPGTNVVDVLVARLRHKLRAATPSPRLVCVRGTGFTLAD